ncbi:hypothetical protein HDG33_004732 [Paraburkholderia sp. Cpub6]|nr:hypothetical protein [Paraburkholderia sp. Cpub6]
MDALGEMTQAAVHECISVRAKVKLSSDRSSLVSRFLRSVSTDYPRFRRR